MKFGCTDKKIDLKRLADMCGGELFGGDPATTVYGVATDSRTDCTGECFFAIEGEIFDGHDFIRKAAESGAAVAVVSKKPDCDIPYIMTDDTRKALGSLAKAYKAQFNTITVAVTGSVGKTTTKQYIHSILSTKYKTHKTEGNLNNDIGLPLTVLSLCEDDRLLVLEMGMSNIGEISALSKIAEPDIAIITCIGNSHIEHLGSRENICKAKLEITDGMKDGAILLLNGDEPLLENAVPERKLCRLYFGIENPKCDYKAENITADYGFTTFDLRSTESENICGLRINQVGTHNVCDALAAIAAGTLLGINEDGIKQGLLSFSPVKMRQSIIKSNGFTIIEDCYNAGPESMCAALGVLSDIAKDGGKIAVLGEMRELGEYSSELHRKVGAKAAKVGVDRLITVGTLAEEIASGAEAAGLPHEKITKISDYSDAEKAATIIKPFINQGDTVLIKASRALSLERISHLLQE